MENRFDRSITYGALNLYGTQLGRFLGVFMTLKVIAMIFVLSVLSGCMSSVPSTFPDMQVPSSSSSAGVPSPSSSSSPPSGSSLPSPSSGGQPSTPSPSLPTPGSPSSGAPSLPQPPNPLPSPESSRGSPSMPSIPTPGSQDNSESGDASGGLPDPNTNSPGGGQQGEQGSESGGNEEFPSGDISQPAGDQNGSPDGDPSNAGGGDTMQPGDDGSGGDGWETSNQLPDPGANDSEEETEEEGGSGGGTEEDELAQVLGELDGEILNERNVENSRVNDELAEGGLPGNESEEMGSDNPSEGVDGGEVTTEDQSKDSTGVGEDEEPLLPETRASASDTPDARDEEVVARQLREAALAEEDPELKEKLWDEYEAYVEGLK